MRKKIKGAPFPVRVRPSRIGFVVMHRSDDATAILADGGVQTVSGHPVVFRSFCAIDNKTVDHNGSEASTRCPSFCGLRDIEIASEA